MSYVYTALGAFIGGVIVDHFWMARLLAKAHDEIASLEAHLKATASGFLKKL